MDDDFKTAMRHSLALTRAGDLSAATRKIQQALGAAAPATGTPRPRRPLGATLDGLRKTGQTRPSPANGGALELPSGTQIDLRRFDSPAGGRNYLLFQPSRAPRSLRGLIVMLHGCTQTAEDFARGTDMMSQAEAHGFLVAYPEQTKGHNMNRCWNWFEPAHQMGESGEPAIHAGLAKELAESYGLPAASTFAAGLSAGGAMAAILGAERPDVFRAVGVHSGLAPGSARDLPSAFAAMRGNSAQGRALGCPAIIFHGDADSVVAPVNATQLFGSMRSAATVPGSVNGRRYRRTTGKTSEGHTAELWQIEGAGHAWSGGASGGSHTDTLGPDASVEMISFFNTILEGTA